MTFTELVQAVMDRCDLTSSDATARVGREINSYYKRVTSTLGLVTARRTTVQQNATPGVRYLTFSGIEKVLSVQDRSVTPTTFLKMVSVEEIDDAAVGTGQPTMAAVYNLAAQAVTVYLDTVPQTAFTLYAEGYDLADTLAGSQTPLFPESFHDVLIEGAVIDERLKQEKLGLAEAARETYDARLSDLRMFLQTSAYQDIHQGKRKGALSAAGSSSGSSSTPNGAASYTQTGLITFDRDPSAPFAVTSGSAKVANLDVDLLDGQDGTAYHDLTQGTGTLPVAHGGTGATSLTAHGVLVGEGTSPIAATAVGGTNTVLHGITGADPTFSAVVEADVTLADVVTNNASTARHGFLPKLDNNAGHFLNGQGAQVQVGLTTGVTGVLPTANGGISVDIASAALPLGSGQVTFPAAQNPSAGANVLDDYEEGTWTPVIGGSGGTSGQAYTYQVGTYVKIGKLVIASFNVLLSTKGTITGTVQIQGLPFTVENLANYGPSAMMGAWSTVTAFVAMNIIGAANTTAGAVAGATTAATALTNITTTDLGNTSAFFGTIIYRATA